MEECPRRVRAALRTIPSAYEVGFNLDKDEVYVSYDASRAVDVKAMAAVVEQRAGFKAWVKGDGWADGASVKELKALPL